MPIPARENKLSEVPMLIRHYFEPNGSLIMNGEHIGHIAKSDRPDRVDLFYGSEIFDAPADPLELDLFVLREIRLRFEADKQSGHR
jgi:hypothetical protein